MYGLLMAQLDPTNLMTKVVQNLATAFELLCHSKLQAHHNHDIWDIRHRWVQYRHEISSRLLAGEYSLTPAKSASVDGHSVLVWSGIDTIVLKAISITLEEHIYPTLGVYDHCYHTKGRGLKSAITATVAQLKDYDFVFKTDIKSYYASLNAHRIQDCLSRWIKDRRIMRLIWQYCDRVEDVNGHYHHCDTGIPKGGSLSVLIGTLYLIDLDELRHQKNIHIIRYMDDIIIFCKNRYTLRSMIKKVYGVLDKLKLTLAYSKTYIGKAHKGFDFLGYVIGEKHHSLTLSKTTVQRFRTRLQRLYEHRAGPARVALYVKRWCRWATSGLADLNVLIPSVILNLLNNPDDAQFLIYDSCT
jgi:RNA-directed DNA polymerase